ncbi:MAG: histidine kinase [Bacteroidia bacterium]|nr:histidine kinase [Bacteroidia bacterium]
MNKKLRKFYFLCLCILSAANSYCQSIETTLQQAKQLYEQNNYPLAQEKYLQALKQAEKENNPTAMARASLSLARCHYFLYDHTASFKWSYNALYIAEKNHLDTLLSQAYYFLGVLYIEDEKVDSAEKYAFKAIELMQKENDFAHLSQTYSTLAELYLNTSKNPAKIEKMIAEAEKYAELSNDKGMLAFAKSKRYNYAFFFKKDYKEALEHINVAEKLYLETGNSEAILNAYRGKAECLIMLGDTSARTYMWKWFHFKDSILQKEKAENIAKFETLYETEKKEAENKILHEKNEQHKLILVIVVIVFLLFVAVALWLFNRNRLKKKQQELQMLQTLQKDKERIARDLHDNVGGQLSYIIYSLDGINDEDKEKRSEVTESINQSVKSVISSLRETIWAISDANINVQDFSDKLKVFARDLFKHSSTKISFTENITSKKELNALLGLSLYRICQEILNNAFKYAAATEVKIDVQCEEEKLLIMISDNGVGFDAAQKNDSTDSPHGKEQYGLQNIKKRATEFGVTLTLETEINRGTKYVLLV